ncbi:MAG: response regulator [Elusimicrobiota bacterium]
METVFIVERDPVLAAEISQLLLQAGHGSRIASDAVQAQTLVRQKRPALIIVDAQLPAGGGASLHKTLRLSTQTAAIPVLFLSSVPESVLAKAIDFDGATYFLAKPVGPGELLGLVAQILDEKSPPGEKTERGVYF